MKESKFVCGVHVQPQIITKQDRSNKNFSDRTQEVNYEQWFHYWMKNEEDKK